MTPAVSPRTLFAAAGRALAPTLRPLPPTCAVRLIDSHKVQTHRVNGSPMVVFTHTPSEAIANLLKGRNAAVCEARLEPPEDPS